MKYVLPLRIEWGFQNSSYIGAETNGLRKYKFSFKSVKSRTKIVLLNLDLKFFVTSPYVLGFFELSKPSAPKILWHKLFYRDCKLHKTTATEIYTIHL